jgi:hypothetical protein
MVVPSPMVVLCGYDTDSTVGPMADMTAVVNTFHARAGLRTVMSPHAFDEFDVNHAGQCPGSATTCGSDVTPFLLDAATNCCPSDYLCFMPHSAAKGNGALPELDTPLCGQRVGPGSPRLRLNNGQISQCILLLGLLDSVPRFPLPSTVVATPPPGTPIPPTQRRSEAASQRQAALLAQYVAILSDQ